MANHPKRPARPATMADVAERVGVSRQLVGFVFSGRAGVAPETEAKIRSAAIELEYRPNRAAQSLRADSTKYIGVVFHPEHSSMVDLLPAITNEAKARNYDLILSAVSENQDEDSAVDALMGHRCNGLILFSTALSKAKLQRLANEIPLVSVGRRLEDIPAGSVSSEGEAGIEKATDHLIALGHKKITYVLTPDMLDSEYRLLGYQKAMLRHGLAEDVISIPGNYVEVGGYRAAQALLKRRALPTAVICNNDQCAMGLQHTLLQAGVRVPQDVSLVGHDDTVSKFPYLNFTTVRQDAKEIASSAVADLAARIAGEATGATTHLTSSELVIRSSSSAPKAAS